MSPHILYSGVSYSLTVWKMQSHATNNIKHQCNVFLITHLSVCVLVCHFSALSLHGFPSSACESVSANTFLNSRVCDVPDAAFCVSGGGLNTLPCQFILIPALIQLLLLLLTQLIIVAAIVEFMTPQTDFIRIQVSVGCLSEITFYNKVLLIVLNSP